MPSRSAIVAICNYDFRASGTVAKAIEIATRAREAGLNAEIWTVREDGPLRARVPSCVPVIAVGQGPSRHGRRLDLILHIPALARALRARKPQTLVSGGNHFHKALRAALLLSGQADSIRAIARASNSAFRKGISGWRLRWRNRRKYAGYHLVAAVSEELAAEIAASGVHAPVRCIPNGVDLQRVRELGRDSPAPAFSRSSALGTPVIISMGRIVHQKGFDVLIDALAMLPASCPARLVIIGEGDESYRELLQARVRAANLSDRVDWLGYLSNPFAVMARCDLFVSASRWEGGSNTLLEALALGLPLVATDCPTGNREVIERGPFGTLAPADDAAALADAIRREWKANRDRQTQREGAAHWDIDRCLEDWVRLLSE